MPGQYSESLTRLWNPLTPMCERVFLPVISALIGGGMITRCPQTKDHHGLSACPVGEYVVSHSLVVLFSVVTNHFLRVVGAWTDTKYSVQEMEGDAYCIQKFYYHMENHQRSK